MAELPATISATLANSQEGAPFLEDGRPAGQPALDEGGRYTDQRLIGVGGMGEVRLVYDGVLKRTAVLKTVRSELAPEVWDRLIAEAGLTAGLQHPRVVPVYDAGRLTDGRPFYVMREVRGFTLAELIEAVHKVSVEAGRWSNTRDGWTLRGLIGVVASVAATICNLFTSRSSASEYWVEPAAAAARRDASVSTAPFHRFTKVRWRSVRPSLPVAL